MDPNANGPIDPDLVGRPPGSIAAIMAVRRERAEMEALDNAVADGLSMRTVRARGTSIAYSIRLDAGEVGALERRAAMRGLKPTVLARNLIRMGLAPSGSADVADAIDRLAAALEELRAVVGDVRP